MSDIGMAVYDASGERSTIVPASGMQAAAELMAAVGATTLTEAVAKVLALIAPESVTGNPSITFSPVQVRVVGEGEFTDNTGKRQMRGQEIRTIECRARIKGRVKTIAMSERIAVCWLSMENGDALRHHADNRMRNLLTRAVIEAQYS